MSEGPRVLGLGAGGHARVALESLRAAGGYVVAGFLDPREDLWGTLIDGVPVLGGDDLLAGQFDEGVGLVFVGLGSADDTRPRRRLYDLAQTLGMGAVTIIDPSALVSSTASVHEGATVLPRATINAGSVVGENAIINTAAVVDHDCRIGAHAHVASGATLASGVQVGDGAHVGAGAVVRQGVSIGEHAVVGIGAAVVRDVEPETVVTGVPASFLRVVNR